MPNQIKEQGGKIGDQKSLTFLQPVRHFHPNPFGRDKFRPLLHHFPTNHTHIPVVISSITFPLPIALQIWENLALKMGKIESGAKRVVFKFSQS